MSGAYHIVCTIFILILSTSSFAQNTGMAILRSKSSAALVNGTPAHDWTALFPNDLVEILKNAAARIQSPGSAAEIEEETVLQFAGDELGLEHGSLSIYTSRGMRVRVGCLTVAPVNTSTETLYEVVDRDGRLTVHATRGDVYIDGRSNRQKESPKPSESGRDLVREGERRSRIDKCEAVARKGTPGRPPLLDRDWVRIGGAAAVGYEIYRVLCQDDDAISPHTPSRNHCPIP